MNLILSRHGNTFGPNDPVVWAGSANDLPLVEAGVIQAETLAKALIEQNIQISDVFCGPLQRTKRYAEIVSKRLKTTSSPLIDDRLNEIDYGAWSGLTNEQIIDRFGEEALQDWDERCRWPKHGRWGGTETQTFEEVRSFITDLVRRYPEDSTLLVITSNGRLRYFLKWITDEFEKRIRDNQFKVKTGHICKLSHCESSPRVCYWNANPAQIRI